MTGISEAISDPGLLGGAFTGPSWARWRSVLSAAEGRKLGRRDRALFAEVAEREPPRRAVRELWCVAGRRSGKDSVASAIATVAALDDHRPRLRPGERASVLCLACDRIQARIVLRYISGYFNSIPLLQPLVARETDEGLELTNGVEIVVATNSYRSVRGRTIVCAIFDEVAYWRDELSANPDFETYTAIEPGLATLPGSMLIGISSPYRRSGLLFSKWRKHYGEDDNDVLVVKGPTKALNPTIPDKIIADAFERDPEAAAAEWSGEWRSDLADFVSREVVESSIMRGVHEIPPQNGLKYKAFIDPSGGSADSMTLAIAHRENDLFKLDCVREARPPFSPASVVGEFYKTLLTYGIDTVTGDAYAGMWPREVFMSVCVTYKVSDRPKNTIYGDFLPLLNSGCVGLLDNQRLIAQLCNLERRTSRAGKDSIDHPSGGHDDLINAAAGAIVTCHGGFNRPITYFG